MGINAFRNIIRATRHYGGRRDTGRRFGHIGKGSRRWAKSDSPIVLAAPGIIALMVAVVGGIGAFGWASSPPVFLALICVFFIFLSLFADAPWRVRGACALVNLAGLAGLL